MTRPRTQGGFTLIAVLAVVLFFSLVVVALLGLVSTDAGTTSGLSRSASQRRAADAALQVAMTRIKTATAADLAGAGPCAGVDGQRLTVEASATVVTCRSVDLGETPIASPGDGGTVLHLGGNYSGTLDDAVYLAAGGTLADQVAGNVAAWLTGLLANGPTLVHGAYEPLVVAGDVRARQWTLGVREDRGYPALDVAGGYVQGDPGFLGGLNLGPIASFDQCGVLTGNLGGVEAGLRVRSRTAPVCRSGSVADRDTAARAGLPVPTGSSAWPGPPVTWNAAAIAASARSAGTCTPGSVKTFSPGSYNALQTGILNNWFTGGCAGTSFRFEPGDYYFDTAGIFRDEPRAIVIDDATSNWVFGTPSGDPFPQACDPDGPGVTLTLSSSTSLKHKAGQVAICGARSGTTEYPAIYQPPGAANQGWYGEPDLVSVPPAAPGAVLPFATPTGALATVTGAPAPPAGYLGKPADTSEGATRRNATGSCSGVGNQCVYEMQLEGFGTPSSPAPAGPLRSAVVKVTGTASGVVPWAITLDPRSQLVYTIVNIGFNDGSGQGCYVKAKEVARSLTSPKVIDLLAQPGTGDVLENSCVATPSRAAILTDAGQLQNAIVVVDASMVVQSCGIFCASTGNIAVDHVTLETVTSNVLSPSPIGIVVRPEAGTSLTVFGRIVAPNAQVEVKWAGDTTRFPIVVGGLAARGLASSTFNPGDRSHVGVLVARTVAPPRRQLVLRAVVDGDDVAETTVILDDSPDPGDPLAHAAWAPVLDPGRTLQVVDWRFCRSGC